jgi:hypothetical protein
MKEAAAILEIIRKSRRAIDEDNPRELKYLSNQVISSAAISQDPDNTILAVLIYSLGKIFERDHYRKMEGWEGIRAAIIKNLDLAAKSLEKENLKNFRIYIGRLRNAINKISSDLKQYITDVFEKAKINKAFKLYEHGLSSEQTAAMLGVSLWDLAGYIGQSTVGEAKVAMSMPVADRIKIAEDILG